MHVPYTKVSGQHGTTLPHRRRPPCLLALALALLLALPLGSLADDDPPPPWRPQFLGFQANLVGQKQPGMRSPYEGENSLPGAGGSAVTSSFLASTGMRLSPTLQAYLDLRLQRGIAINNGSGMAAFPNGDFTAGSVHAPPYATHAYLRYYIPLGSGTAGVASGIGKLADREPVERLEFKIGRILPSDDFDKNRYMDNAATQFLNLGLVNNPAWDFAQTSRGVTNGVLAAAFSAHWALRIGSYQMPRTAGGAELDRGWTARSDNAEIVWRPNEKGALLRFLAYRNAARMGDYRDALALALRTGLPADLAPTRRPGRTKRGAGLSFEIPMANDGDTGVFGCAAWNDGKTEDFSYTESDRNICVGFQLGGARWSRKPDRFAAAVLINGLSKPHRAYLAAGGAGIQLGDGTLAYGREEILEIYYVYQAADHVAITPDLQYVRNPGFNRDRGPAFFAGVRTVISF